MKYIIIAIVVLCSVDTYSQLAVPLLKDTFPFTSNLNIIEFHKQEYGENGFPLDVIPSFQNLHSLSVSQLEAIFDIDPELFWAIDTVYVTPLQLKLYKQTSDYKSHLDYLKALREKCKNALFYTSLAYDQSNPWLYDIQKKGFEITIADERDWMDMTNQEMALKNKMLGLFSISKLKTYIGKSKDPIMSGAFSNYLFIPVNEDIGLAVEKLGRDCTIFVAFNYGSFIVTPCQFGANGYFAHYNNGRLNAIGGSCINGNLTCITPKVITILFVDTQSNRVICSKTY